jgi:PBSX family phage terminase large subunit
VEIANLLPFSSKGLESTQTCEFLTVWEGAVRSSKTICSVWAWMWGVIRSPDKYHLILGKDQSSALGNCIENEYGLIALSGGGAQIKRDHKNRVYVDLFGKHIDVFGGDNVSSYKAFRGRSYGSTYFDEGNLLHPNTLREGFNRTIASKARKHYMTLNPDVPGAYIYREYLDVYEKARTPGYRWWHFTLDDNPAITEERKAELKAQYTGVFYQRYILGLRVRAEGGCFPGFDRDRNIIDTEPAGIRFVVVGVDIGKSRSATTACALGFFWDDARKRLCLVVLDELYYKENASTGAVVGKIAEFIRSVRDRWTCADVYVDSEEQLIIKDLRNLGLANIHGAIKKEINDRIRFWDLMFTRDRAYIMRRCKHNIEATESAVWNSKVSEREERLDDGSTDIDTLDAREYAAETHMSELVA